MEELKDIRDKGENNLEESLYRNIDFIVMDEIREFVLTSLEKFGTIEKLIEANVIVDVLKDLLVKKKLLSEQSHQSFVDVMVGAALLHNLFYKKEDWRTLLDARYYLESIGEESKVNPMMLNALFSTIEAQEGEDCPITELIPKPGTPTELFAYTAWFVKSYL